MHQRIPRGGPKQGPNMASLRPIWLLFGDGDGIEGGIKEAYDKGWEQALLIDFRGGSRHRPLAAT